MIIAKHFPKSLAPFDRGMRSVKDGQWLQQAIFEPLMIPLVVVQKARRGTSTL
jgi:hypothetical protein